MLCRQLRNSPRQRILQGRPDCRRSSIANSSSATRKSPAPQISPDGKYISFVKPWKETRNIYVKGVDEPFSAARLLTTETKRPIPGYFWTRDGKYIVYVKDNDGDENYNIFAVDPAAKPAPGADAPPSRDLTGLKGTRVVLYDLAQEKSRHPVHRTE